MYKVKVEKGAKASIKKLYREMVGADPDEWLAKAEAAIADLAESADKTGLAHEDQFYKEEIRHRMFARHVILLTKRGNRVHVLWVRAGSQEPVDDLPIERA